MNIYYILNESKNIYKFKISIFCKYISMRCILFVIKFAIYSLSVVTLSVKKSYSSAPVRSPENYLFELVYNRCWHMIKKLTLFSVISQKSFLSIPFYSIFYLYAVFIRTYVKNFDYTINVIDHTLCIIVYLYNTVLATIAKERFYVTLNAWTETLENPAIISYWLHMWENKSLF